jgi:5-methylcytosine-specific restriction protein B
MSGDVAVEFWNRMATLERDRHQAFRVEARFAQDGRRATPVQIVLDGSLPQAVIGDELAALRDKVDPVSIATRHPDERDGEAWRTAFDSARGQRQLTLNQACRLVLGPVYVPERQVHAYNANHELRVRASDLAPWLPELAGEGDYEYSLSELYGLTTSEASNDTARADSNRIALTSIRALLGVRANFDVIVHGTAVHVELTPGDAGRWPRVVEGLEEGTDGPWPSPLHLTCTWRGGETTLKLAAETWGKSKTYYGVIGLSVRQESLSLVWITVPKEIWSASDDTIVNAPAALSLSRRGEAGKEFNVAARKIVDIVKDAGVPFASTKSAEAFRIHVPSGRVLPDPEEAVRRLTIVALAKQPFLSQASGSTVGVFDPGAVVGEIDLGGGISKQDLLPPLPGGVRSDKDSLDKLVGWLAESPRSESELGRYVLDEFDTDDATLVTGCQRMLLTLGFARAEAATLSITPAGLEYLQQRAPESLFALLDQHFVGMVETLLAIRTSGVNADIVAVLRKLPGRAGVEAQINARLNWMLALGCTERTERGELLTALGRHLLGEHESGTDARVVIEEDDGDESPVDSTASPGAPVAPPGWHSDRLDLRSASVAGQLGTLKLPPALIDQACAALSAGKHLLFVGPPGTGKTELALCLARAAQTDGYCTGLFASTASADWTTYETIGGYALEKSGGLAFRSGVFLRALEQWQWLLIDELNRADIDKAFGELMTVLSGKGADTPYLGTGNRPIGIGPEPTRSHVMPKTFRVIATMNLWDKTSLFRLSYAVQRRFAIIHVGQPDAATYAQLLQQEATRSWLEPPLATTVTSRLVELFGPERLLRIRPVGPAIPLDMIRYMRRRQAEHVGMSEALAMYLLPQLEGIEPSKAEGLWGLLAAAVGSDADAEGYLRERFQEIFPLAQLAKARA